MATSVSTLLTRLAYRLGENASPTNTSEAARRLSFLNEGRRKILSERLWWFTLTQSALATVADREIYTLPSDVRQLVEVRLNGNLVVPLPETDAFARSTNTPLSYPYRPLLSRWFLVGTDELHIVSAPTTSGETLSVASLTSSGTTATLTTTTDHTLGAQDFVIISGANPAGYNGTHRITAVPTSTTLTFTVPSGLATPATGTMTAQHANLVFRYYKQFSDLTADDTDVTIPDQYADILVAYAYGRYGLVDDSRASSVDGFSEYNDLLVAMQREQTRRSFAHHAPTPALYTTRHAHHD